MWQGKDAGLLCGDKELLSVVPNCENHRMEEVEEDGIEDWLDWSSVPLSQAIISQLDGCTLNGLPRYP